jgi:cytochrome c
LLVFGTGIVFNPEKLPFLKRQIISILSWNVLVKLALLFALFFGITGGVILSFIGRPRKEGEHIDFEYRKFAHSVGAGLAFAGSIVVPLLLLFNIITLPDVALSLGVFGLTALTLFLLLAVCLVLYRSYRERSVKPNGIVFVLYILVFLSLLATDNRAMGNAYREKEEALEMRLALTKEEGEAAGDTSEKEAGTVDPGEAVFTRVCSGCHQFDARVVGPPLGDVLPKYAGDPERLKNFIRNPVKVDPDYPPMPKLSIKEEEIEVVADYLLGRI